MAIWFGGDYNPEQWPSEVWDEDARLMQSVGVNTATVGVFSWSRLQPREGEFDFAWLDDVIDRLWSRSIGVFLATATASPPPWLSTAYPETLPVTDQGVRLSPGSRQHFSPHSARFRELAATLVEQLASRYGAHPAVRAWHVGNEFGCHVPRCYSDEGADAFRAWLREKYGTVGELNRAWGTAFWSQQVGSFDEVDPPRAAPTTINPMQLLDFDRFSSDALLDCYRAEAEIIRRHSDRPITTNFMGLFKPLDYWAWAAEVDFVCDDSYPDPADPESFVEGAMAADLMRSLRGGQPWLLAEQATSAVNWRPRNVPKAPGQLRAKSLQALARGANGVMFFQWRQSRAGAEKFHSAMLPHAGTGTRVFREVGALGGELPGLDAVIGTRVTAEVAIVLDWDAWWALEQPGSPAHLGYLEGLRGWYSALLRRGVTIDFVRPEGDLTAYRLVIVARLFCASPASVRNIAAYVDQGGTVVVGYQSFILDSELQVAESGYLGELRDVLGVSIEEFAPLPSASDAVRVGGALVAEAHGTNWTEYVHAEGAEVLASFLDGGVDGWPAVTAHRHGRGRALYVATEPDDVLRDAVLDEASVLRPLPLPQRTEAVRRGPYLFTIDHGRNTATIQRDGDL